ncbi:MAG: thermonuclease family protein [Bacteriovoracales bacterium]|nr:thermonuclease family protein [Bacteriovoracales bacterium]
MMEGVAITAFLILLMLFLAKKAKPLSPKNPYRIPKANNDLSSYDIVINKKTARPFLFLDDESLINPDGRKINYDKNLYRELTDEDQVEITPAQEKRYNELEEEAMSEELPLATIPRLNTPIEILHLMRWMDRSLPYNPYWTPRNLQFLKDISRYNNLDRLTTKQRAYLNSLILDAVQNGYSNKVNKLSKVQVRRIIDGDSVEISDSEKTFEVRLSAIDCPEYDQSWGDRATDALKKLIGGRCTVYLETHDIADYYNRIVATIYKEEGSKLINVNERMVVCGHAWVYRQYYKHLPKWASPEKWDMVLSA